MTILALRVDPNGNTDALHLPENIDFLEQVMESMGTDVLDHVGVVPTDKGAGLDVWFDDLAPLRPEPQPNDVATALIAGLGRTENLYGTVFFTGGLNSEGVVQGLKQATVHGLVTWCAKLAKQLNLPENGLTT
jgi:hypothetical protein